MSNEHTEQSERAESNKERLSRLAREAGALVENWMTNPPRPGLFYMTPEQLERFAILLAADKPAESGVEGDDEAVAYLRAETTPPKYRGWAVCEDDDPNGFPVYRHHQPQPSALPAEVVKDAERRQSLVVALPLLDDMVKNSPSQWNRDVYAKAAENIRAEISAIDAAMLKPPTSTDPNPTEPPSTDAQPPHP